MNHKYKSLSAFFRKATASSLALLLGISLFASPVEARLIFTTEGDGNLIDQDINADGDFSLYFGNNLEANITFDPATGGRFTFSHDIQLGGDILLENGDTISNAVAGTVVINGGTSTNLTGGLDVQGGDITLQNDETISNAVDGEVLITATETQVSGDLDIQGGDIQNSTGPAVTVGDNLVVTGTSDLQGDISDSLGNVIINDALDVTGNIDSQGTISDSTGNLVLDDTVEVTAGLDVQGAAGVTLQNNDTITNTAAGTIDLTATNVDTSANLNVGTNLDVTGTSTLDGDVTLTADAQIINLRAENATTVGAPVCTDATDLGRMYYDTDTEELLYCYDTGGGFAWKSTASVGGNVNTTFVPEFGSFATLADGTNNTGTLEAEFDDTADHGFYKWSTRKNTAQDYDLVVQWKVPENFSSFQSPAISVDYKTATITLADNQIDVSGEDTAGTTLGLATNTDLVSSVADTWTNRTMTITGGTFTTGQLINLKFKVQADNTSSGITYLGPVKINYVQS